MIKEALHRLLHNLRHKRDNGRKKQHTVNDASLTGETAAALLEAIPGLADVETPEELTEEALLTHSLDIAFALLRHERALMAAHLVDLVAEVCQAPLPYSYKDFIEAAEQDPRFQVSLGQLVALAEEPDPWSVLLERVEQEETHINGTNGR
jgi:hypothetical protein